MLIVLLASLVSASLRRCERTEDDLHYEFSQCDSRTNAAHVHFFYKEDCLPPAPVTTENKNFSEPLPQY